MLDLLISLLFGLIQFIENNIVSFNKEFVTAKLLVWVSSLLYWRIAAHLLKSAKESSQKEKIRWYIILTEKHTSKNSNAAISYTHGRRINLIDI